MSFWKGFEKRAELWGEPHEWDRLDRLEHIMDLEDKHKKYFHKEHLGKVYEAKSEKEIEDVFHTHSLPREVPQLLSKAFQECRRRH